MEDWGLPDEKKTCKERSLQRCQTVQAKQGKEGEKGQTWTTWLSPQEIYGSGLQGNLSLDLDSVFQEEDVVKEPRRNSPSLCLGWEPDFIQVQVHKGTTRTRAASAHSLLHPVGPTQFPSNHHCLPGFVPHCNLWLPLWLCSPL